MTGTDSLINVARHPWMAVGTTYQVGKGSSLERKTNTTDHDGNYGDYTPNPFNKGPPRLMDRYRSN